jgi:hypothetical protein
MRSSLAVLTGLAIAVASSPATAGRHDDWVWPDTWTASLTTSARKIAGQSLAGPSLSLERAWGRRRWQAFASGRASWYFIDGDHGPAIAVGSGVRWLARSFIVDSSTAMQLFLDGGAEVDHAVVADGVTIPQLWFGWGVQVRRLNRDRQLMIRFIARVHVGRAWDRDRTVEAICRGCAAQAAWPIEDGVTGGMAVAW